MIHSIRLALCVFALAQLSIYQLYCQNSGQKETSGRWRIALTAGIEHHDKRLYDFPQYPSENLLAMQPETFGTYSGSVIVDYKLVQVSNRLNMAAGIGIGHRKVTFNRPYTPPQQLIDGFRIQLYSDHRSYTSLVIPVSISVRLMERLSLDLVGTTDLNIFQRIRHSWDNTYGSTDTRPFRLERAAVQGGPSYALGRKLEVSGLVRLLYAERRNFQLIVNTTDRTFTKFDGYNPLQLSLRLARTF